MTQFRKTTELFQHLIEVLSDSRFLKMQGLNQEVPFFLCPFPVKQKLEIEKMLPNLKRRLHDSGIKIVDINLYDLCMD